MTHVDDRTYSRLLDGSLDPGEARAFGRHLLAPCDACEAVIGNAPADALDGRVDAALTALAPVRAHEAGNDLEWQRIARRIQATTRPRRPVRQLLAIAAVFTAIAGASLAVHSTREAGVRWDGVKGAAPARQWARLRFAVVRGGAEGRSRIAKGVTGERVAPRDRLQFQVELGRAAEVALVRVGEGEAPELIFLERLGAGTTTLSMGAEPAAVALDGLWGRQRFAVVAGPPPLDPVRAVAAAAALGGASAPGAAASEGVAVDAVEVDVR